MAAIYIRFGNCHSKHWRKTKHENNVVQNSRQQLFHHRYKVIVLNICQQMDIRALDRAYLLLTVVCEHYMKTVAMF